MKNLHIFLLTFMLALPFSAFGATEQCGLSQDGPIFCEVDEADDGTDIGTILLAGGLAVWFINANQALYGDDEEKSFDEIVRDLENGKGIELARYNDHFSIHALDYQFTELSELESDYKYRFSNKNRNIVSFKFSF